MIADHPAAFGAGLRSSDTAFSDLKEEDRLAFVSILFGLFEHYENIFRQVQTGHIDADTWDAWSVHIPIHFSPARRAFVVGDAGAHIRTSVPRIPGILIRAESAEPGGAAWPDVRGVTPRLCHPKLACRKQSSAEPNSHPLGSKIRCGISLG
jgi:hypothetical protein